MDDSRYDSTIIEGEYEILDEEGRTKPGERYGRPIRTNPGPPYITYGLILLNVVVWLVESLRGGSDNLGVLVAMGAKDNGLIAGGQYWRLFTPIFLHAGIDHLFFNSFALFLWGRYIEILFGKGKYILIYLTAGLTGSLASYLFSPSVSVGASGAIFGLLGTLLYFRRRQKELFNQIFGLQVVIIIAINLFDGFTRSGIDNWGHIGGLIGGYLAAHGVGLLGDRQFTARKMMMWLLIAALFIAGLPYGQLKYRGQQEKQLAYQYYKNGDYEKAESNALKAQKESPGDKEISKLLSEIYLQLGVQNYDKQMWDQAETYSEKAVDANDSNSRAYLLKALLSVQKENLADAGKALRKSISIEPNYGYSYYLLGYIQYRQGDVQESKKSLERSLQLDSSLKEAQSLLDQINKLKSQ